MKQNNKTSALNNSRPLYAKENVMKKNTHSVKELQDMANQSVSLISFSKLLGYTNKSGGVYLAVKKIISDNNLDVSHFTGQSWNKDVHDYRLFVDGKRIKNSLPALVALRGHKCEKCNLDKWMGADIKLEVHHVDGNQMNSKLDNLQILCPNCHSLTDNWRKEIAGKGMQKKLKRSDEEFVTALRNKNTVSAAITSLGMRVGGENYRRAYELIMKNHLTHLLNNQISEIEH